MRVLPPVGRTVKVAFYSGSCDSLARSRPLLQAMLGVCSKPRAGTYRYPAAHVKPCYNNVTSIRTPWLTAVGSLEL